MKSTVMFSFMLLMIAGCNKQTEQAKPPQPSITQGQAPQSEAGSHAVAGITWAVPSRWNEQPQRQMRVATYGIPSASGEGAGGECAVFFFGGGQGGDVNANIDRWIGQFENASPKRTTKTVNEMDVTLVEITGTYLAPSGPQMQSSGKLENYRLLGAIVAAPDGSVFYKFTGPAEVVAAAEKEFHEMIESIARP
ncbi:MAG: hypothetical protein ACKVRP_09865 [Bacteroidota bacterium]